MPKKKSFRRSRKQEAFLHVRGITHHQPAHTGRLHVAVKKKKKK